LANCASLGPVSCGNLELDFPPNGPSLMAHMRGFARYETLIKRNARYEVHSEMRLVLAVDQFGGKKSYRGATQK
jgi:hypothetical protein